ncbi:MAG TPA: NAD-dependent epimerase/dehydratase family protein [Candidatus Binataceae bacterium]|jgi:nucleoside-diphosphate-sugar epimerase|nr:NAD-dependent epimerase/dehydratase family protein [Candidatus Binataceae bacterium]
MKALVVGGTGPTGPFLVKALLARKYAVTILHRGTHEVPEIPSQVEHIHADPHFRDTLDTALKGRIFDLVVATYGRLRFVAEALKGKTGRFIGVGGVACYRGHFHPEALFPVGMKVPTAESGPLVESEQEQRFSWLIAETERAVLRAHPNAALLRYPYVYGPYQLVPREWCVIRRILDGRRFILLPDGGLTLMTHGYAENLAHAVMLAVERPQASAGQIYNCGDEQQLTLAQIVEVIARAMGRELEIIAVPDAAGSAARALTLQHTSHHQLMDLHKIRSELGYRDPVSVTEALARTVRWYVEHQPERGGDIERRLHDPFDYVTEDKLAAICRDSLRRMAELAVPPPERHHPYAHPKTPDQPRDHRER